MAVLDFFVLGPKSIRHTQNPISLDSVLRDEAREGLPPLQRRHPQMRKVGTCVCGRYPERQGLVNTGHLVLISFTETSPR